MKNKSNLIFIHKLLKALADSMLAVFIPLIILKSTNNFKMVVLYFSVHYPVVLLLNIILKKFLQKFGVIAIILHIFPIIAIQFILSFASLNWLTISAVAVLSGLYQTLYSVPLNLLFTFSDRSANVAKFQIATNVGKLIFIILSGLLIGSNILNSVLILAIAGTCLYLLSIVPILYGYKMLKTSYESISNNPPKIDKKDYRIFNIFHMSFSLYQVAFDYALPLYLYINNLTFESVAIIMALIELCKILSNLLANFLNKHGLARISAIISTVVFISMTTVIMIIKVPVALYICSVLIAISFPLIFVPSFNAYCKKITADYFEFDGISFRDIFIYIPRPFMFLPYLLIPSLFVQFGIGIASSIVMTTSAMKILPKYKAENKKIVAENSTPQTENTEK